MICPTGIVEYFLRKGWTAFEVICPSGNQMARRLPKLLQRLNDLGIIYEQDFRILFGLPTPPVYGVLMSRLVCLSIAVVLSLLSAVAPAAPIHKRPAQRWHGYGFLPGYHQPLNNSLPLYAQKDGVRRLALRDRRPWYIDPVPRYFGYDGNWHYFGRPGFYGGRYNGGSFGPCWARTPIGPVWTCG